MEEVRDDAPDVIGAVEVHVAEEILRAVRAALDVILPRPFKPEMMFSDVPQKTFSAMIRPRLVRRATENRPVSASKPVGSPAFGSVLTAISSPPRNEAVYAHSPSSSGVKCTLHLLPAVALVSAAFPSAA